MSRQPSLSGMRRQRGVVLFVAMIVLVVMALAGVAMVRQSGTGLSIAGNLAFKQAATSAGDFGTEAALDWWLPLRDTAALDSDVPAEGYYSDWGAAGSARLSGDPTTYDWGSLNKKVTTRAGNTVSYIIERLCLEKNMQVLAADQICVRTPPTGGMNKSTTTQHYPESDGEDRFLIHYRISTLIEGPKQTRSYIQVLVR